MTTSKSLGIIFFIICLLFGREISYLFSTNEEIAEYVSSLSVLLAFSMLFNSIQPVLSGVPIGAGFQSVVAYVNLGCYYVIGVPIGIVLGYVADFGIKGLWVGMLGGIVMQTIILAYIVWRTDWDDQVTLWRAAMKIVMMEDCPWMKPEGLMYGYVFLVPQSDSYLVLEGTVHGIGTNRKVSKAQTRLWAIRDPILRIGEGNPVLHRSNGAISKGKEKLTQATKGSGRWKLSEQKPRASNSMNYLRDLTCKRKSPKFPVETQVEGKRSKESKGQTLESFSIVADEKKLDKDPLIIDVHGVDCDVTADVEGKDRDFSKKDSDRMKLPYMPYGIGEAGPIFRLSSKCEQFLNDFQSNSQGDKTNLVRGSNRENFVWKPPDVDVFKVNCSAMVDKSGWHIGIGIIIQDFNGEVFASCAQSIAANYNFKAGTLAVILRSIHFVLDCGLEPCMFEADDASVVKWFNDGSHSLSENGVLLDDIKFSSSLLRIMRLDYVPKKANRVAQGLAQYALVHADDTFWMEDFPDCVKSFIEADKPG
ncbi:hypothetical protein EZV62_007734 [Acer yangbiense]|uniref:Protein DETOXIFICATION n=1 Tax=Acer yangbiense TaxID=1000413 RepID=A0A5C7IC92_9ROSI|nr:hypothetical protein EZV62_007734 [Acer yangbiense]